MLGDKIGRHVYASALPSGLSLIYSRKNGSLPTITQGALPGELRPIDQEAAFIAAVYYSRQYRKKDHELPPTPSLTTPARR